MKPLALIFTLVLAACAAPPRSEVPPSPVPQPAPAEPASIEPFVERDVSVSQGAEIWAYHAFWMGDAWRVYDLAAFKRLLFFDLEVGKDGRFSNRHGWPEQWEALRTRARAARVPLDPVVTLLNPDTFSTVFRSAETRARLLAETVALARTSSGLHLDVEIIGGVQPAEIEAYRAFVAQVRKALDAPPRKTLTAFVPAQNILYGPRELALLDVVVAQGYDVHWQGSPRAGPPSALEGESPAAWRTAAANLLRQGIPPRKLVFSTPLYGYEWPTVSGDPRAATRGTAAIVTYAPVPLSLLPDIRINALSRVLEHGLRREEFTQSPWYAFRDRDGWRQGWFDDAASLAPRLDFVLRGDYRGVALFVLGYDGGALLESIQARFRAGSATPPGAVR
ncbi:MAG TPA: glycosyl hydrolase family 18 protein [Usitatibacter sp.]|nr:glycosyl hydrolase family 18 protein [Usitatibacter sp.]